MNDTLLTLPERLNRLKEHLLLAGEFGRAAILLVVYRSEFRRAEAEKALQVELEAAGQQVVKVRVVAGQATSDLAVYLGEHPASGQAIFFVYDVGQGGAETLQFLNYRRELFVAQKERLVLWLTEQTFTQLAREAPDFFAFRGRTLEFLEAPNPTELKGLSEQLAYYDWDGKGQQSREAREVGIRLREKLLAELPPTPEFNEQRAELLYALAAEYHQLGQSERALALVEQVDNLTSPSSELWIRLQNLRGIVYHDLGRYEEAVAAYQQAIDLDPNYAHPHNGLGNVYRALGRYEEAIAAYQQAIALDPNYATPQNNLGNVYGDLGRYEEAIAAYQQAIALDPKLAYFHNGLGNVYGDLGRYEEAVAAYQQAIALDPNYAYPHNGLGIVYRDLGRYEEALAAYQQAIALDPNFAYPHNNLGNVYRDLGRYEEAIAAYQQAIALDPNLVTVHMSLAECYRQVGQEEKYQEHIELARGGIAREDEYNRACFEAIVGNHEAALALLAQGLAKRPGIREWAREDPDFASLRDDPRFLALVGEGGVGSEK